MSCRLCDCKIQSMLLVYMRIKASARPLLSLCCFFIAIDLLFLLVPFIALLVFVSYFIFFIQIYSTATWSVLFVVSVIWFLWVNILLLSLVDFFEWLIILFFSFKNQIKLMCAKEACNQSKGLLNHQQQQKKSEPSSQKCYKNCDQKMLWKFLRNFSPAVVSSHENAACI